MFNLLKRITKSKLSSYKVIKTNMSHLAYKELIQCKNRQKQVKILSMSFRESYKVIKFAIYLRNSHRFIITMLSSLQKIQENVINLEIQNISMIIHPRRSTIRYLNLVYLGHLLKNFHIKIILLEINRLAKFSKEIQDSEVIK